MSDTLRKPWIRDEVKRVLDDFEPRQARGAIKELCNDTREISCPIAYPKFVQITQVISFDDVLAATVSDKHAVINAEFSKDAIKAVELEVGKDVFRGVIVKVLKCHLHFEGSDGILYNEGHSLQDQLWDTFSAVNSSVGLKKDQVFQYFTSPPVVRLRMVIEAVNFVAQVDNIIGQPKRVDDMNIIRAMLKSIPVAKNVIWSATLHPQYSGLITKILALKSDMTSSSEADSNEQSASDDESGGISEGNSSSNTGFEDSNLDTTQFATQAITPLRSKNNKSSKARMPMDTFHDLDFSRDGPGLFVARSKAPARIGSNNESNNMTSKEHNEAKKLKTRQLSISHKLGCVSGWSRKTVISAKEAYIPRDQQKQLDDPKYSSPGEPLGFGDWEPTPPPNPPSPALAPPRAPSVSVQSTKSATKPPPPVTSDIGTLTDQSIKPVSQTSSPKLLQPPTPPPPPVRPLPPLRIRRPIEQQSRPVSVKSTKPVPPPGNTPPDTIRVARQNLEATQSQLQPSFDRSPSLSNSSYSPSPSPHTSVGNFEVRVSPNMVDHPSQYEPAIALPFSRTESDSNSTSEGNVSKQSRKKSNRNRSQTYPQSESEDETGDEPGVDLILPDCPQPIVNPFGHTRLQVYGMLGAQSANRWKEAREKKAREREIQDSQDDESDDEDKIVQESAITQELLQETSKDANAVGEQLIRCDTITQISGLIQKDHSKQLPVSVKPVEKASLSNGITTTPKVSVVTFAPLPHPPNVTSKKPGSAFLTRIADDDDVEDDDFESIPIIPLGRAAASVKQPVFKVSPPVKTLLQDTISKSSAVRSLKPKTTVQIVANTNKPPSTALDAQRPMVHVKRTPYPRSRSFNNAPAQADQNPLEDETFSLAAHFEQPNSGHSSTEMPDRQMTSFELLQSSASVGSSQESLPPRPPESAPQSQPSTKAPTVVQVNETPHGKLNLLALPEKENANTRDPDESFVLGTKFDQLSSADIPNRQVTSFLGTSNFLDSRSQSPATSSALASETTEPLLPATVQPEPGKKRSTIVEETTRGKGKRPLESPSARNSKKAKLNRLDGHNPTSEATQHDSQEAASQETLSPGKIPAFITQAGPTTLVPLTHSASIQSSPPTLAHPTPLRPLTATSTAHKRSPSSLNIMPPQPKRSRHDVSSPKFPGARALVKVFGAPKCTSTDHTSSLPSQKVDETGGKPRIASPTLTNEIPNSHSSGLGEFIAQDSRSTQTHESQKTPSASSLIQSQEDINNPELPMDVSRNQKPGASNKPDLSTTNQSEPKTVESLPEPTLSPEIKKPPEASGKPEGPAQEVTLSDLSSTPSPSKRSSPSQSAPAPPQPKPLSSPSIAIITEPSYAGIRSRPLAIPGYDLLSDDQRRRADEMRKAFLGDVKRPGCVSEPRGDERNVEAIRKRLDVAGKEGWWRDEGTPWKLWVRDWMSLGRRCKGRMEDK
ncbi:hypothetical protein EX30DRAFT_371068 [Ascodesmis nigricans]|uniref:Shelterin complex subunit TPP1/Est3 domain-containing protein n=1 Tax=Ascodesmis nigricans TaxID=341454 RepID=A0A4S2MZ30_9PEZI|nr:hypothetical protein EX30DRAFT_371068 [Ascodesmis nigricans]